MYRYVFLNKSWSLNYVVYRHFDGLKCSEEQEAVTHRIATFVCESAAKDYCDYRNEMIRKYGSDEVSLIVRPDSP